MPEEKKPAEPFDFSYLGGRRIDHRISEKLAEPIDFSHIGGCCIFPAPAIPEESTGDDTRTK
jgi:hypothetical protein